jgi:hypothetical protein
VPFGKDTLLQLAVISLAPVAPLVLTMIPLGELLDRFLHDLRAFFATSRQDK